MRISRNSTHLLARARVLELAALVSVSSCFVFENKAPMMYACVLHVQRIEKMILQVICERLARDLLNDISQEEIPGVVVKPFFARIEVELIVLERLH